MDFDASEEGLLLQHAAKDFAERTLRPHVRDHEAHGVPRELVDRFDELQLARADLPGALGAYAQCLTLEELAVVDAHATVLLDGPARYFARETTRAALIVDVRRSIQRDARGLSGRCAWTPARAPEHVVVAQPGATFVVRAVDAHIECVPSLAFDAVAVTLHNAPATLVSTEANAFASLRIYHATLLVGLARAAYEYTAAYVKDRVTFGRALAQHQAVAFLTVEMAMAADVARLAVHRAAWALDHDDADAGWCATTALLEAAETANAMTERAVQLLGGHGYLKDHPVEKWMREARALSLAWGGTEAAEADARDMVTKE